MGAIPNSGVMPASGCILIAVRFVSIREHLNGRYARA